MVEQEADGVDGAGAGIRDGSGTACAGEPPKCSCASSAVGVITSEPLTAT